ncbi:MAG: hypothetical protein LBV61_10315 [Burkholderiaceae bacterium]|nr:hypothetical protein [Burkholderiaceae bacterium]
MTTVQIELPDTLVQRARSEGLLSDGAVQQLLEDALRRQAGRRLMQTLQQLHAANIAPMSEEELDAEIRAVRAQRRAQP